MQFLELVESAHSDTAEVIIFDDEVLQGKFNKIESIFAIKGYPSKQIRSFEYRSAEYSEAEQMKDVSADHATLDIIDGRVKMLQQRLSELDDDDQQQSGHIAELRANIKGYRHDYTMALVRNDGVMIRQIETAVSEAENSIRQTEQRQVAMQQARKSIAQYLETVQAMFRVLDNRRRKELELQAREVLHGHIEVFAQQVAEYKALHTELDVYTVFDRDISRWINDALRLRV